MRKFYIFNETDEDLKSEIKQLKKLFSYAVKKEGVSGAEFNIIFVDDGFNVQKVIFRGEEVA